MEPVGLAGEFKIINLVFLFIFSKTLSALNEKELPCRPCSVYGKIRNKYIDCAKKSMIKITPEVVL